MLKTLHFDYFILFEFLYTISIHILYNSTSRNVQIDILGGNKKDQFEIGETNLFYYR